jgi:hypothetical protein
VVKKYTKKERKKIEGRMMSFSAKIESDLHSLHNYLTAANIRNKIKHPLFMAFRFKDCFKIYMNHDFEKLKVFFFPKGFLA